MDTHNQILLGIILSKTPEQLTDEELEQILKEEHSIVRFCMYVINVYYRRAIKESEKRSSYRELDRLTTHELASLRAQLEERFSSNFQAWEDDLDDSPDSPSPDHRLEIIEEILTSRKGSA